jgi:hypothetical protein
MLAKCGGNHPRINKEYNATSQRALREPIGWSSKRMGSNQNCRAGQRALRELSGRHGTTWEQGFKIAKRRIKSDQIQDSQKTHAIQDSQKTLQKRTIIQSRKLREAFKKCCNLFT